jgi:hypothetical protein
MGNPVPRIEVLSTSLRTELLMLPAEILDLLRQWWKAVGHP